MELKTDLKKFLIDVVDIKINESAIKNDDNLIEQGIVDSLVILRLLAYIEEKYSILLNEDEINENNFSTIKKIENLIKTKLITIEC